jgi:FkbH-like protein
MTLSHALALAQQRQGASRKLQIGLICGFEPLHLATFLRGHLAQRFEGESADFKTGLYGDLEGTMGRIAESDAEAAVLILEWSTLDSRLGLRSTGGWALSVQQDILDSCAARFARLLGGLQTLAAKMPVAIAAPTLPLSLFGYTPVSRMSRQELELERQLATFLADASGLDSVSVMNPAGLDKLSQAASRSDPRMELNAGFPYSLEHASVLAGQIVEALFPRPPMKGLITDLDGTLWSGILGEGGVEGVSWSLSEHSQIHGIYQQLLKHFSEIGVLLAVASKNELALVEQGLHRRDIHVPGSAFFPVCADWGAKSRHVAEILRTWNVGADSVVFVDDSDMELDEVRMAFPSMTCLQFPARKPSAAVALFEHLRDLFGKSSVTREDGIRQASIQASEAFRQSVVPLDTTEFLRSLQGRVTFDNQRNSAGPRLLELVNKTNQFNLNGKRLQEGEWLRHLADPAGFTLGVSYDDKFGPLGIIGVMAGKQTAARIDVFTWVMSCRAFSRRIELHTLQYLFDTLGAERVHLAFRATERNSPLQEFFLGLGLRADGENELILSSDQFRGVTLELPHRVSFAGEAAGSVLEYRIG